MADKTITERLQPSILDRLTDQDPDNLSEAKDDRVIDIRRLRDIIKRDLSWLLNTSNQDRMIDAELYPYASKSVLNYGVHEVSGEFSTEQRAALIRSSIQRSIELFEPRIKEGTLDVVIRKEDNPSLAVIVFDIHADMWAQPLPLELYLRSEVDVTTGQLKLEQRA